ncbi:MAG: DUF2007 domain-containing protein [Sedimentisphaerales bacterium]|nr:DUF2007 domain-containing protein [Sedimentisphaerales bacterium]
MDEKLVTAAQFDTPENAHLAKIDLENAGIPCFVGDENMPIAGLYYTLSAGGIKILVRKSDLERAREVLQEAQNSHFDWNQVDFTSFEEQQ